MNSETRNEFDVKYDGRIQKIRKAAAATIEQLDQLRSGTIAREAFDAKVARIAQQNLHCCGCDLIVPPNGRWGNAIPDQGPEHWKKIRFNQKFFPSSRWIDTKSRGLIECSEPCHAAQPVEKTLLGQ